MKKGFSTELRTRSEDWVEAGVITAGQREAILARTPEEPAGGGRFAGILAFVGGGLLLAGVCLLISANWREIGDWTKIGGLVALLLAAHAGGWWCRMRPGAYPKIGDGLFMVGAGLFMAGIALVSQIYHLNARPASGVLVWWAGIAALPWLTGSKGVQFVSMLAGAVWLGMEMTTPGSWLEIGGRESEALFEMVAIYTVLGAGLWTLARVPGQRFAGVYGWWGVLLVCGGLYVLGFVRHGSSWRYEDGTAAWNAAAPVLALAAITGLAAWRRRGWAGTWMGVGLAGALVPVLAVIGNVDVGDGGWLWSGLAWASLFGLNLAMVHTGLREGREGLVNLAVALIALNIVTRYFDLFGTMLEGGVFFVVSGALVLGVGFWLERKRRVWLTELRTGKEVAS